MNTWDTYTERSKARGFTMREASLVREVRTLDRHAPDSLSYQRVLIYDKLNGFNALCDLEDPRPVERNVTIINSDNLNEKHIISMPGEDIEHGSLVEWMNNRWLVTERDANTTIYTKVKMVQCNYLLRWITDFGHIYEQWCIIEDGTKLRHIGWCVIVWHIGNGV